jgi:hypothetical protein
MNTEVERTSGYKDHIEFLHGERQPMFKATGTRPRRDISEAGDIGNNCKATL